jgi:hypothetical protein
MGPLLIFYFDADPDPDPAFFTLMQIQIGIQLLKIMRIHADPEASLLPKDHGQKECIKTHLTVLG